MLSITRHRSDVTRGLRTHPVSDQAVFGRKSVAWWLGLRERWGGSGGSRRLWMRRREGEGRRDKGGE